MILVTGAGGKTGLAVIGALSRAKITTRALVYREELVDKARSAGASEVIVGDMRDSGLLDEAVQGIDSVYHICPNVHPDELLIGQRVIESSQKYALDLLVYHSVIHPQIERMPHHWRKLRVEEAVMESKLPYIIFQPAPYMQNLFTSSQSIAAENVYRIPYAPPTRISMVDLIDVAEAAVTVLTSKAYLYGIYELCGIPAITQTEVAEIISDEVGYQVDVESIPIDEWKRKAQESELNPYAIDTLELMFRHYENYGLYGNNRIMSWILKREPTSLAEFIEREANRFRL